MEENREQPIIMPATALDKADENEVMSEVGSQDDLGKFKSVQALMDAYNSLQSEFTKKCQMLKSYEKDKAEQSQEEQKQQEDEMVESNPQENENGSIDDLDLFLAHNDEAKGYIDEIKERFGQTNPTKQSPYEVAWANVILSHMKEGDKASDPIINQYVLSDENVKNKIIENYLTQINKSKAPITISSRKGDRVSAVNPDTPKTLAEAKKLLGKMFS